MSKLLSALGAAAAVLGRSSVRRSCHTWKPRYAGPGVAARVRMVDLRSDTATMPWPAMRQAMVEADLGDGMMIEDPTVYGKS